MVVDILLWMESISKIGSALSNILDSINTLRLKWHVKGSDLEKLKKDIQDLSDKISYTKNVGEVLAVYIQYFDSFHLLFTSSDKLKEMINSYFTILSNKSNKSSGQYITYWEIIDTAFNNIKKTKSENTKIMLGRMNYLDNKDAEQIKIYVNDFNKYFEKSQTYLKDRNADELRKSIDDMSDQALSLYRIFQDSINNMTTGLMRI